jgi:MFS family permease
MKITKRLRVHFRRSTRALQDKNFRLFFFGQTISYTGVWITNVAMAWLIYRLTGSAALLGLVTFASQFPAFLVSPFAGVHIDRMDRKKVIQVCLSLSAFQSLLLGVLTLTEIITIPQLIVLGIFQAIIDGFYLPARQSFITELVSDRSNLGNAIALNAASFHFARLVGPALGGLLILFFGEGTCFVIDGLTYAAILYSLQFIKPAQMIVSQQTLSVMQELSDGIQYIRYHPKLRMLLSFTAFFCLIGISHTVLLPVLVKSIFHESADKLGILLGASGLGSLLGAILLAIKGSEEQIKQRMIYCANGFGIGIILLSLSPILITTIPILILCGFCFISIAAGASTLVQITVKDQYRGRVMSFFAMCFTGMMPVGSVGSGWISDQLGVQQTLLLAGLFAMCGGVLFFLQRESLTQTS